MWQRFACLESRVYAVLSRLKAELRTISPPHTIFVWTAQPRSTSPFDNLAQSR